MASKLDYLKKYVSKGGSLPGENGDKPKKKKKKKHKVPSSKKGGGNIAIFDDDVDWRALMPVERAGGSEEEDDPEDKPVVAEVKDETVVKWQPFGSSAQKDGDASPDLSPTRHGSPDISPQRKKRHDSPDVSAPRRKRHDSPGVSPPRRKRHDSPDVSPLRKKRHDSPDGSPPRNKQAASGVTSLRKKRHDSPDVSPPRRTRGRSGDGQGNKVAKDTRNDSPPKRKRHDSPDMSPPRRNKRTTPDISSPRRKRQATPDISPPRRKKELSHKDDLSEPCKVVQRTEESKDIRRHRKSSQDMSPPRRKKHTTPDISPPRRRIHDSPDISPPRRKRHDSPDISPPRRPHPHNYPIQHSHPVISHRPRRKSSTSETPKLDKASSPGSKLSDQSADRPASQPWMASGKKAGLQDAEVLRQENAAARARQEELFHNMDPSESGRGAETVYRDKEGRRINLKLERLKKMQEENKKMEEEEKFMEWGKGVATLKMAEEKVQDDLYEMSKPLARYADDEDLERMLKERERDGDPMLKFIKKKPKVTPTGKPKKERPTYRGSFPANRFGVRPGYRWDGVDRSNGFEKAWFSREANSKATADVAYKWSVENM